MGGKAYKQVNQTKKLQKAIKPKEKYQNQKNSYKIICLIYLARNCTRHCIHLKTWKKRTEDRKQKAA